MGADKQWVLVVTVPHLDNLRPRPYLPAGGRDRPHLLSSQLQKGPLSPTQQLRTMLIWISKYTKFKEGIRAEVAHVQSNGVIHSPASYL